MGWKWNAYFICTMLFILIHSLQCHRRVLCFIWISWASLSSNRSRRKLCFVFPWVYFISRDKEGGKDEEVRRIPCRNPSILTGHISAGLAGLSSGPCSADPLWTEQNSALEMWLSFDKMQLKPTHFKANLMSQKVLVLQGFWRFRVQVYENLNTGLFSSQMWLR